MPFPPSSYLDPSYTIFIIFFFFSLKGFLLLPSPFINCFLQWLIKQTFIKHPLCDTYLTSVGQWVDAITQMFEIWLPPSLRCCSSVCTAIPRSSLSTALPFRKNPLSSRLGLVTFYSFFRGRRMIAWQNSDPYCSVYMAFLGLLIAWLITVPYNLSESWSNLPSRQCHLLSSSSF